jgi:AcrR family transcriptional regulator
MATPSPIALEPRKLPRQARSQATVDAIFEATIQVLLAEGLQRLTTIRVAERAGASVGTLYQYYPHKQALLYAVLQRHLRRIGEAVQTAAQSVHHTSLATMVSTVVEAFVYAKTERLDEARALYVVGEELDSRELVRAVEKRGRAALAAMLATATDVRFDDLATVSFMFAAAVVGPTRAMLEGRTPKKMMRGLRGQLESLCLGYLEREARSPRR